MMLMAWPIWNARQPSGMRTCPTSQGHTPDTGMSSSLQSPGP